MEKSKPKSCPSPRLLPFKMQKTAPTLLIFTTDENTQKLLKTALQNTYRLILVNTETQTKHCLANTQNIPLMIIDLSGDCGTTSVIQTIQSLYPPLKIIAIINAPKTQKNAAPPKPEACFLMAKPLKPETVLKCVAKYLGESP